MCCKIPNNSQTNLETSKKKIKHDNESSKLFSICFKNARMKVKQKKERFEFSSCNPVGEKHGIPSILRVFEIVLKS